MINLLIFGTIHNQTIKVSIIISYFSSYPLVVVTIIIMFWYQLEFCFVSLHINMFNMASTFCTLGLSVTVYNIHACMYVCDHLLCGNISHVIEFISVIYIWQVQTQMYTRSSNLSLLRAFLYVRVHVCL